jgi:phenylalanine ammonia-lyase
MVNMLVEPLTSKHFSRELDDRQIRRLNYHLEEHFISIWKVTAQLDISERCKLAVDSALPILVDALGSSATNIWAWHKEATYTATCYYKSALCTLPEGLIIEKYLGHASRALYCTIRHDLGVPFQTGLREHPTIGSDDLDGRPKKTVGDWISVIHDAIKDGRIFQALTEIIESGPLVDSPSLVGDTLLASSDILHGSDTKEAAKS